MVADEVMAGFGRTGRWFAVDHWDVVPDLMTMAKGLTSSYLPLGAVAMRHEIAENFETTDVLRRADLQRRTRSAWRPRSPRSRVYEEDGLIDNAAAPRRRSCASHHERLAAKHPSVGAHRNLGLFGIIDLVRSRDPWTPLTPFNGTSDEMKAIGKFLRENGPVHDARQQLDPHQPAAVHHRGPARRGLRDHRSRPRHRRRRRGLSRHGSTDQVTTASGVLRRGSTPAAVAPRSGAGRDRGAGPASPSSWSPSS